MLDIESEENYSFIEEIIKVHLFKNCKLMKYHKQENIK